MGDHNMEDTEDTISLYGLKFEDDNVSPQLELSLSSSSSSSSSPSSFENEFSGFFGEELWNHTTSPKNIIFCGKIISTKASFPRTSKMFGRSSSDSFNFMKTASWQSTPRSKSLPKRLLSSSSSYLCKSKWEVFMFGFRFGSGKFPTTMDMSDIKRRQSTVKDGRRSGRKSWWRLVDVLGCRGGYEIERDTIVVTY